MKNLKKRGLGYEFFVKWGIIIVGTAIILIFLFYNAIPGVVTRMEKMGLIEAGETGEPPPLTRIEPETPEEKQAETAFDSVVASIEKCRNNYLGKNNCTCNLDVPMFEQFYTIQFWPSSDRKKFNAYLFLAGSYPAVEENPENVFKYYTFEGLDLCTSKDLFGGEMDYVPEQKLNMHRQGGEFLMLASLDTGAWGQQNFDVLGVPDQLPSDQSGGRRNQTQFKLYRVDDMHICFFTTRRGNKYHWYTGARNVEDYMKEIEELLDNC